jgi:ATP-dependent exoDNAse (exonuclease V) beta subunit
MANFRTEPSLVVRLNQVLGQIFATDDGSGVTFSSAQPARAPSPEPDPRFDLHLKFVPQASRGKIADPGAARARESARAAQTEEIVALIRSHFEPMNQARVRGERYRIAVLGRARSALAPIAQALREAAIPFRAVDLEKLAARPEVLDALALARALLNPHDRVAWLGVLRAPWCGLTLADLHIVAGGDEPELLARPVPGLLAERLPLLSAVGRQTANRVLETMNAAPTLRAANPTASLGTFLESVWLRLEGEECVDATARANLALLFACLDRLPAGEQDLLGPGLDAALDKLTALPDPAAGSDCGVQLMTIHKSKGLEFEVVIVPDLQAGGGRSRGKLLSWLERGLAHPDESGDITEFLIGPLQPKGADRGKAKEWVDSVYRERESQEDRRILYVAATRAREQLHLFARPAYKVESDGSLTLPAPTNSLLATAWPALEEEVRTSFEKWKEAKAASETAEEQVLESIAASAQGNLLVMPSPVKPTKLRRVPPNYKLSGSNERSHQSTESPVQAQKLRDQKEMPGAPGFASETWESEKSKLYARHEGSLLSRALGRAVHSLFENLARLRMTTDWQACRLALQSLEPHIAAQVRTTGVDQAQAAGIAAEALRYALDATRDPLAQWILSPHADAANEVSWVGVIAGSLGTVRVDRVFRAGPTPFAEGENCWWIIDYKTAHAENLAPEAALPELRLLFSPQIEAYAAVLRNLHSSAQIRVGLYYPRMSILDWWEL